VAPVTVQNGRQRHLLPTSRAAKAAGGARRRRSSPEEVQKQKEAALVAAKNLNPGFSKGEVMKKSAPKVDLGHALSLLVAEGKLSKRGDRRITTSWASAETASLGRPAKSGHFERNI